MNRITLCLTFLPLILSTACSDSKEFRVEGSVRGLGSQPVAMHYITANTVRAERATAVDGKFFFTGVSRDYTLAEISTGERRLGFFVVRNGEHIKCRLDADNPDDMSVSGNKPSEQVSAFLADNAQILADRDFAALDSAVEAYVTAHPDRMASTLLLMNVYDNKRDPDRADSLMTLITPEARPVELTSDFRLLLAASAEAQTTARARSFSLPSDGDSLENFMPTRHTASLLYFRGNSIAERRDTVLPLLRRLRAAYTGRQLHITEIGMTADSVRWASMSSPSDSITWTRVFAPGGRAYTPFEALSIPGFPFFITIDGNGNQLYRGTSVRDAAAAATHHISNNR